MDVAGPGVLPSAYLDGHAGLVPRADLVYDGQWTAEILRAVRRPYLGQAAAPHNLSQPLGAPP